MKNLWTPWRMEHIQNPGAKTEHCLFEPPGSESCSREHFLLFRDPLVVVILNRFPHTNGHLLVAPARHTGSMSDLNTKEAAALMEMIQKATDILTRHLHPGGFNIGCNQGECAGAGIADHLHFHIVPRWEGDHNFLSVLAEVRSIPEFLVETYDRLQPDFSNLLKTKNT